MLRRNVLKSFVPAIVLPFLSLKSWNGQTENPDGLPLLKFDGKGKISNWDELQSGHQNFQSQDEMNKFFIDNCGFQEDYFSRIYCNKVIKAYCDNLFVCCNSVFCDTHSIARGEVVIIGFHYSNYYYLFQTKKSIVLLPAGECSGAYYG